VILTGGHPYVVTVEGRLDLFSAEAIEQAWRAVPRPRRVLIELGSKCTLVTPKGRAGVAALCEPETDGGRTAVCPGATAAALDPGTLSNPPFFLDRAAAVASLQIRDHMTPSPILVHVSDRVPHRSALQ